MKRQNHISQLTLELYTRGLVTRKERRQVEKSLETDSKVRSRYQALKESEQEIDRCLSEKLSRFNIPEAPPIPVSHNRQALWGIIAAAVLLCVLIPMFLYLKSSGSNKENTIAEESGTEAETTQDIVFNGEHNTTNESEKLIQPNSENSSPVKPIQRIAVEDTQNNKNTDFLSEGITVAVLPETDTGIRTRGGGYEETQSALNIPSGLNAIFENMFADRQLSAVVIPARIMSIGKNAFTGNPLVSVTIGENVLLDNDSFPGHFAVCYNAHGKAAGTYIRQSTNSEAWEKK